jgi:hypothetical protein
VGVAVTTDKEIINYEPPQRDPIAERVRAYTQLICRVELIEDRSLRVEGIAMLTALRETIQGKPRGELHSIKREG